MLNKTRPVIRLHPEDLESLLVFGEFFEIAPGQFALHIFLVGGIHQGNDSTLEAGAAETSAVNTRQAAQYLIYAYKLR